MEFKLDVSVLQKRSRLQIFGNQTCLLRRGVFVHRRCKDCHYVHTTELPIAINVTKLFHGEKERARLITFEGL